MKYKVLNSKLKKTRFKHKITRLLSCSLLLLGSLQLRAQDPDDVQINIVMGPNPIAVGQTGQVLVQICNNSWSNTVPANKLISTITIPLSVSVIPAGAAGVGSNPDNWTVVAQTGGSITMTNSQPIGPGTCPTYFINLTGTVIGADQPITGVLTFNGAPPIGNLLANDYSPATVTVAVPLPIALEYFKGEAEGCNAALSWKTGSEKNFSHFEVMRSTNGSHFETIATVAGTNIAEGYVYNYTVRQDAAIAYYKLKLVDLDGSTTFSSDIRRIAGSCDQAVEGIVVYPNPVRIGSEVNVKYASMNKGKGSLSLCDIAGRVLYTAQVTVEAGNNLFHIPVNTLSAGTYMIRFASADAGTRNLSPVKLIIKDNH